MPGQAHLGNIHFPPNGTSDYDYVNPSQVISFAPNWKRYPFLFQETEVVSCATWNCEHLDYLAWWYRHLPHFKCKDQFNHLNNWWAYIVDYNEGKALEMQTSNCDCAMFADSSVAVQELVGDLSIQLFPNPVVDRLHVALSAPARLDWEARLYSPLGVLLMEKRGQAGPETQGFDLPLGQLPSGNYFLYFGTARTPGQLVRVVKIDF
jgi:hypothetical protein